MVVDIWKQMLSAPRQLAGATSLRYMGTDCTAMLALNLSGSHMTSLHSLMLQGKMHRMWRHAGGYASSAVGEPRLVCGTNSHAQQDPANY